MIILVPVLILTSKALPGTSKASFTLPIVTLSGICVLFAFQAHSAQIPLEDSYYTKKILYSLFLYLVPLLVGIVAVAATRPFAHWPQDARKLAGLSTILVGSLLVAVTVSWTGGPAKSCAPTPGSYTPPGWWHTFCRQDTANTNKPILGTLALRVAESFDAGWAPYLVVDTKSRAAAGIISKVGSSLNPNYTDITVAVFSAHTAAELKKVMDENPKLKVRVILYYVSYPDMDKLAKELGSNRMQIQTIQN
jgi:hypothetical protein